MKVKLVTEGTHAEDALQVTISDGSPTLIGPNEIHELSVPGGDFVDGIAVKLKARHGTTPGGAEERTVMLVTAHQRAVLNALTAVDAAAAPQGA